LSAASVEQTFELSCAPGKDISSETDVGPAVAIPSNGLSAIRRGNPSRTAHPHILNDLPDLRVNVDEDHGESLSRAGITGSRGEAPRRSRLGGPVMASAGPGASFRSLAAQVTVSSARSSRVVVRDRDIVDDADEHQEPKENDEDRERPTFGHPVASP
jgi:hypothetical protein